MRRGFRWMGTTNEDTAGSLYLPDSPLEHKAQRTGHPAL